MIPLPNRSCAQYPDGGEQWGLRTYGKPPSRPSTLKNLTAALFLMKIMVSSCDIRPPHSLPVRRYAGALSVFTLVSPTFTNN
jgi:hypothetical protein